MLMECMTHLLNSKFKGMDQEGALGGAEVYEVRLLLVSER